MSWHGAYGIGGSIRIPSAFCGTYGFRPTSLRMPYKVFRIHISDMVLNSFWHVHTYYFQGIILAGEGQESIRCVVGPLANSVDDLELFMKSTIDQKPWDVETSLVPLSWRPVPAFTPQTLKVGIMLDDG